MQVRLGVWALSPRLLLLRVCYHGGFAGIQVDVTLAFRVVHPSRMRQGPEAPAPAGAGEVRPGLGVRGPWGEAHHARAMGAGAVGGQIQGGTWK